ncbi:hypothetical protein SAMN05216511_1007 [Streptomyces sp. KS_16]|nr:hypothetical protein SAMN05216511_1007 [Streptomyces sp. KS_16]
MQIVLGFGGRVDVDHEIEVVDVQAASRDVGGHQDGDLAVLELREGAGAVWLGLAAVQGRCVHPAGPQVPGELIDRVLGVQEQQYAAVAGGDLRDDGVPVGAVDDQHMVVHRRDRTRGCVNRVDDGVVEVAADQPADVAVQGGGEQHPLAVAVHLVEHLGDLRQEAHVTHLVGFVEDGDPYPSQAAGLPLNEVVQATRGGDDDLRPVAQRSGLPADRQTADDRSHPQPERVGVRRERFGDLLGQLPGRYQDQSEGLLRLRAPPGRPCEQRQTEGERLARSGAPAPQDVASREGVGQRGRLDREGLAHAALGERAQHLGRQVQIGEGGDRGHRRGEGRRLGDVAV